jgi:hypothetical protein
MEDYSSGDSVLALIPLIASLVLCASTVYSIISLFVMVDPIVPKVTFLVVSE